MTRQQRWTAVLACTAVFLAIIDGLGTASALPAIAASFHATSAALRWVVSAFLVAAALALPLGAQAADRFGPRWTLTAAWAVTAAGSAACAVVPSVGWLIAARVVQGAGSAAAVAGARRLHDRSSPDDGSGSADASPARRMVCAAAVVTGPLIVGAWAAGPGWRWYFGFDAVVGAAGAVVTAARTREAAGLGRRLDLEGLLASAVGLTAVVWALSRGGSAGWLAPDVVVALSVGALALGLAVTWLMPVGPLHRRVFLAANTAEVCFFASVSGPVYAVSWDMQRAYALGALGAGLRLTMWTAVAAWPLAFRAPVRGAASSSVGRVLGLSMHGAGLAVLAWLARGGVQRPAAIVPLAVSGVGVGLALGAMRGGPSAGHRPGRPGPALAVVGAVSVAGAALGVAYPGAVFPVLGAVSLGARHSALAAVLRWAAVLAAVAAVASLVVPTRSPGFRPVPESEPPGPRRPRGDSGHSDGPHGPAPSVEGPASPVGPALRPVVPLRTVASTVGATMVPKPVGVGARETTAVEATAATAATAATTTTAATTAKAARSAQAAARRRPTLRLVEPPLRDAVLAEAVEPPPEGPVDPDTLVPARPRLTLVPRAD